jgi:competence protein ComEA
MKILVMLMLVMSFLWSSIDINTASVKELSALKGVGKTKAEAIVAFRKGHCFKNIDELALVKGIGKKIVAKNKKDLTVKKCK